MTLRLDGWDAIVIGAGIAGLSVAALLADTGKKVLVLEKESYIGGRAVTFNYQNYILELGPHALMERSVRDTFARLNQPLKLEGSQAGWFLHYDGKWQGLKDMCDRPVFKQMVSDIAKMSDEEIASLDNVPLLEWVRRYTNDPKMIHLWIDLGINDTVIGRPENIPASEVIYVHRTALQRDNIFSSASYPIGGWAGIYNGLSDALLKRGGTITTKAEVYEILIENGQVIGVDAGVGEKEIFSEFLPAKTFRSPMVISTVPVSMLSKLLRSDLLPTWYCRWLDQLSDHRAPFAGFYIALDAPVMGSEIRTWYGDKTKLASFGIMITASAPSAAPVGKHLGWFGLYLEEWQYKDKKILKDIINDFDCEVEQLFPDLNKHCIWKKYYASDQYQSVAQRPGFVGRFLPDIQVPDISGLFLAGDGVNGGRGVGGENAAGSAIACVKRILGNSDYFDSPEQLDRG